MGQPYDAAAHRITDCGAMMRTMEKNGIVGPA
jgi:hypothetical protein